MSTISDDTLRDLTLGSALTTQLKELGVKCKDVLSDDEARRLWAVVDAIPDEDVNDDIALETTKALYREVVGRLLNGGDAE